MKKIVSLLLALVMMLAMSTTVFAVDSGKTITVTGATGHTYNVYQIFTGDVSKEGDRLVLSNVKYGKHAGTEGDTVSDTLLKAYMEMSGEELAGILLEELTNKDNAIATLNAENSWTVGNLATGYYLIVDVTETVPDGETKSPLILKVVEDVTVASKHAGLTSEKKVDDKNDSNDSENAVSWQDSADYDIGDAVPFKISATLPATFNNYATYELVFHDKQASGFDTPIIKNVYYAKADGTKVAYINEASSDTNGYTYETHAAGDTCDFGADCSFSVKISDLKKIVTNFDEGDQIVVEYTAELNDEAAIGSVGNENSMYVHHPDGDTPEDTVIVFTYALTGNKIDGATENALTGAGFTLYKWKASSGDEDKWVAVGNELKGEAMTEFTWTGIDDGKYKLVETTTPAGYNTMADHEFTITADHDKVWTKGVESAFNELKTDKIVFHDADDNGVKDGKLEGNIVNNKGTVLPETGAMGTPIFITVGSIIAMIAVVFMVTRKKMSIYED